MITSLKLKKNDNRILTTGEYCLKNMNLVQKVQNLIILEQNQM